MWQSSVREALTPYLPPPVVQALQQLDVYAEETFGQKEASITLLTTLLVAFFVGRILHFVVLRATASGSAIVQEETRETTLLQKKKQDYDATVLLCGPPNAGKTLLFHQLAYSQQQEQPQQLSPSQFPTLTSLKPNIDIVQRVRFMDLPGHSSGKVTDIFESLLDPQKPLRCILVLDATQPVAPAAKILYQLWEWTLLTSTKHLKSTKEKRSILIACHKSDLPKAKNTKRIQIQVRREMEKLLSPEIQQHHLPEGGLEWETLPGPLQIQFAATSSSASEGRVALERFCETGVFPENES